MRVLLITTYFPPAGGGGVARPLKLASHLPGLGFLTAVLIIFCVGVFATNVVGRRILLWAERVILYIPLVRRVYPTVKDFVDAFSPNRRSGFREFVIVEHPRDGAYSYGFLTGDVRIMGVKPDALASVYVPTNHLYLGDIVLVPFPYVTDFKRAKTRPL